MVRSRRVRKRGRPKSRNFLKGSGWLPIRMEDATRKANQKEKAKNKKKNKKGLKGSGLFENIGHWFTKQSLKMVPKIPVTVTDKKTGKMQKGSFIPRWAWRSAGVPEKELNKIYFMNEHMKK